MRIVTVSRAALLGAILTMAACATDGGGGGAPLAERGRAQVTRFFLAAQIARAAVFVEPLDPRDAGGPRFAAIRGAVEDNLRAAGFTVVPARGRGGARRGRGADARGPAGARGKPRIGCLGRLRRRAVAAGAAVSAAGLGISFPLGKRKASGDVAVDTMTISLRRRSDATVEWEGRAVGEARTAASGDPADRSFFLAKALLSDFPGRTGVTETYPPRRR